MGIAAGFPKRAEGLVAQVPTRGFTSFLIVRLLARGEVAVVKFGGERMIRPPEMLLASKPGVGKAGEAVRAQVA